MRWGNYYLMADTRISLRKENVVLWENTLNSSPQVPPLGFTDSRKMGGGFSSVFLSGKVEEGRSPFSTASPRVLCGGMVQSGDMNGMRGFGGKGIPGGWNT